MPLQPARLGDMKNTIRIRHFILLALVALAIAGCNQSATTTGEADTDQSAAWSLSVLSGNWTTGFPRTFQRCALDSTGRLTLTTEEDGGEGMTVVAEETATVSDADLQRFEEGADGVELMNQETLDIAGDCVGGSARELTYTTGGAGANTFSIVGGCGAELADTDAALAALLEIFDDICARYQTPLD